MPQCCYLAKRAKRPSHTTNTMKFDRIPFDPCNSIKRFDLSPFDQKKSTYLQPPRKILSKAPLLKNFKPQNANKVYMSKSLTKSEQLKQKACLQKRWKLITDDGINRKDISVRNFEVYVNGKRVENWLQNITKEFYILCFNIRSLYKVNRRQTFSNYLLSKNYDIICIAETWLTEEIAENELFLPQYQCFVSNRKSTPKTTSHGGTMICIKRTINSEQLYFDYEVNGSVTACNATLGKKNTLILCCYFPPENSKYA